MEADEVLASILEVSVILDRCRNLFSLKSILLSQNRETDTPETRSYKNFALIVFEPYEVDVVRMAKSGFDRRTRWTKQGDDWISKEVVP